MSELKANSTYDTLPPSVPYAGIVGGTGAAEARSAQQAWPWELGLLAQRWGQHSLEVLKPDLLGHVCQCTKL